MSRTAVARTEDPAELHALAVAQIDAETARMAPRTPMFQLDPTICPGSRSEITPSPFDRLAHTLPCPHCGWTVWPMFWDPTGVHVLPPHTYDAMIVQEPRR